VARPEHPFDGEGEQIDEGDLLLAGSGKVYRASGGWYYTSYQIRVEELSVRRNGDLIVKRQTFYPPETMLKVRLEELVGKSQIERRSAFANRWRAGRASARVRANIAKHRAEIRKIGMPRDRLR
jgi:hypothetical protein